MDEKKKERLWIFFQFLEDTLKDMTKEEEKQVMIEKAINLRLLCDYVVSCSYGDLVLIICMLRDYVKMLDDLRGENIEYEAYYRPKFLKIADKLSEQIEYDYDAAVEKCKKKQKNNTNSDIGEEAMTLAIKHGKEKNKGKEKK